MFIVSIRKLNLNENMEGNDYDKLILCNRNNGIKIKRIVFKLLCLFEQYRYGKRDVGLVEGEDN